VVAPQPEWRKTAAEARRETCSGLARRRPAGAAQGKLIAPTARRKERELELQVYVGWSRGGSRAGAKRAENSRLLARLHRPPEDKMDDLSRRAMLAKASTTIAAALETIGPGALRRLHWHPNAEEWQYWIKGQGRMTVFDAGPRATTFDFRPGDVGVAPKYQGHYILNSGPEDLQVLLIFKAPEYQQVDLSNWLTRTPPELVAQHLNIDPAIIAKFPKEQFGIMPK
jgi:oxalate decarboxylase/phosphoglucose isomerase-like protein (cupin superfamily)